nr:uncharacterized protein LOC119177788 [Rhipicephalus microplus]
MAVCILAMVIIYCGLLSPASGGYDHSCWDTPLAIFDLKQTLDCGYNAIAWSLWIPPDGHAYCQRDSFDRSDDANFVCYSENSTERCGKKRYEYAAVSGENYLERRLDNGAKSQSMIVDTDNCKYLVQRECYDDGSVWHYVTYKETWTQPEIDHFIARVQTEPALHFLRPYSFMCQLGIP